MKKVFWDNPYQHSLVTKVASVDGDQLLFEETIVYSFSGGQESDRAHVNEHPILNSRMEGHLIYYTLPCGHGLSVGDEVNMTIDWPRRYRLMRLHFAAELVLEIVYGAQEGLVNFDQARRSQIELTEEHHSRVGKVDEEARFGKVAAGQNSPNLTERRITQKFHLKKVGAHISETKARIDFVFGEHISSLFEDILREYDKIIKADKAIQTGFTDIESQRRFWKIDDFAEVPCGGTHVKSTKEVGFVTLKRARAGKSIERIEIRLGMDSQVGSSEI